MSSGKLTGKQAAFVNAYLGPGRFNATASAKLAGYRANSKHSFEAIGSENLTRPGIRAAIDEHFRMSRMSAEEVLTELTTLARGQSKDKIKALALLSQHHSLLDGKWQAAGGRGPIEIRVQYEAEQIAEQRIRTWHDEVEKEVQEYNKKALENNERKDKQWKAIRERYKHSSEAVEALGLMFRVMKDLEDIEPYEEPKPEPVEVEIIPPQRRLAPAPVERLMHDVIEIKLEPEPEPQPELCRHGHPPGKCNVIQVGFDCPHWYRKKSVSRYIA